MGGFDVEMPTTQPCESRCSRDRDLLWDKEEGALSNQLKCFWASTGLFIWANKSRGGIENSILQKSLLKIQEALCLNLHFNSFFIAFSSKCKGRDLRGTCQHCPADQHFWNFVLIGNNFVICLLAKNRQTSLQSRRHLRASTCGFRATCH